MRRAFETFPRSEFGSPHVGRQAVSYFVAEDVAHVRLGDRPNFVSACGYEYAPIAVDWADEFEPDAWPSCEDCLTARSNPEPPSEDVVVVQGAYALDNDAHLLVGRDGTSWRSLCGRSDQSGAVEWAGQEWPEAYDECPECAAMVDADLWSATTSEDAGDPVRPQPRSLVPRIRKYRLWVVTDGGIEHRPTDETLRKAMCGTELRPGDVQRAIPMGGPGHCHACDDAVDAARAARRKVRVGRRARQPLARSKRVSVRPARRTGRQTHTSSNRERRSPTGTDKQLDLSVRRMIVPVRFVRGGLPALGMRR